METTIEYWGNIGIMENKMEETTIEYWGNMYPVDVFCLGFDLGIYPPCLYTYTLGTAPTL